MYVPTLRRPLGADLSPAVNPTPWVAGAILLVAAVFLPQMTKKLKLKGAR